MTGQMGYNEQWLKLEQSLGSRPRFSGSVSEIREQFEAVGRLIGPLFPAPDPEVAVWDEVSQHGLRLRVYQPKSISSAIGGFPVGVYYHGGGFVMGDLNAEDADCRYFSRHAPCVIVAVDYRLAPEYKFDEILRDAVQGYEWAWDNAERFSGSRHRVFPIGASAGGCLSLAVANSLIQRGQRSRLSGVLAMSPIAVHPDNVPDEFKEVYLSYLQNSKDVPVIDKTVLDVFFNAARLEATNSTHFVTLSEHLKQFPKTWIVTCDKDPLRDDGVVLEKILVSYGVTVQRRHFIGFGHCFWIFPQLQKRQDFLADVVQGIRFVLDS